MLYRLFQGTRLPRSNDLGGHANPNPDFSGLEALHQRQQQDLAVGRVEKGERAAHQPHALAVIHQGRRLCQIQRIVDGVFLRQPAAGAQVVVEDVARRAMTQRSRGANPDRRVGGYTGGGEARERA